LKIYYAHHIWKYNTEIEKYELDLLEKYFPYAEIINPNGFVEQNKEETEIMNDCFNCIKKCDVIVFSSLSGVVGKGVVDEVLYGKSISKTIFYIVNNIIKAVPYVDFEKIDDSNSNRVYAIVKF